MANVADMIRIIESFAPRVWAESWDNSGLQVGREGSEVRSVLVALEWTEDLLHEADSSGVNLIVTHHPLIFKPLSSIRTDQAVGHAIQWLLHKDVALYSAHTSFDRSPSGMNSYLANLLGMVNPKVLEKPAQTLLKLAVFVPVSYEGRVREALMEAGAGAIGNYTHCTFMSSGEGSFLPGEGTNPFIGTPGKFETVNEVRLETVFPVVLRSKVIKAMLNAHPYEEPAYEVYPLVVPAGPEGLGQIGRLESSVSWEDFIKRVKRLFGKTMIPVGGGTPPKIVRKVAIVSGAGSNLIEAAAYQNADLFLTGDLKHHDYRRGEELGITLVDIGHYASETLGMEHLAELLKEAVAREGHDVVINVSRSLKESYRFI